MKRGLSNSKFTLSAYVALTHCFLSIHQQLNAQVIYVDIDPDIILDDKNEVFGLDLDSNGTYDFAFANYSFNVFSESLSTTRLRQDLLAGPYNALNAIAGVSNYVNTGYYNFTNYYPFAFNEGKVVHELLSWQYWGVQVLALRTVLEGGDDDICDNCYWFYFMGSDVLDHYLGVRFLMDDAKIHYGWIRCDVKDEGRTLVIKDYAYEYQAKKSIVAGNIISEIETQQYTLNASAYSFGKTVYVHCALFNNAQLSITTITGNEVVNQQLTQASLTINMGGYASGIYLVTIAQNGKLYRNKVKID